MRRPGITSQDGDIPGRNDPGFKPWPGTPKEVMRRFVDTFVRLLHGRQATSTRQAGSDQGPSARPQGAHRRRRTRPATRDSRTAISAWSSGRNGWRYP